MTFGSWLGHVLRSQCSVEPLDNCELGCINPWKMVVSQLTIISPMFDCGKLCTKASALQEQVALLLTCGATNMLKRSSGGMATSEQTEVLKKENDRLRSLDSGSVNGQRGRASVVDLKEPLISFSFSGNLAGNQSKFYFCRFQNHSIS